MISYREHFDASVFVYYDMFVKANSDKTKYGYDRCEWCMLRHFEPSIETVHLKMM